MSSAKKQISVTVSKDGPYIVSGDAPLSEQVIVANADGESLQWREGDSYATPEKYALCRCGHSHRAPFCDGTHAKIGFDGSETAARTPYSAQATVFAGPALALLDTKHLCADGRFCDPNGNVWNQVARTDDPQIRAMFLRQVHHCPAGSSRRLRQGRRNNHRGEFARLNRSDRRPGGRLQRADLAARRHLTDVGGRLSLRSPQSHDDLPLWRVEEQAVLRWQSRVD